MLSVPVFLLLFGWIMCSDAKDALDLKIISGSGNGYAMDKRKRFVDPADASTFSLTMEGSQIKIANEEGDVLSGTRDMDGLIWASSPGKEDRWVTVPTVNGYTMLMLERKTRKKGAKKCLFQEENGDATLKTCPDHVNASGSKGYRFRLDTTESKRTKEKAQETLKSAEEAPKKRAQRSRRADPEDPVPGAPKGGSDEEGAGSASDAGDGGEKEHGPASAKEGRDFNRIITKLKKLETILAKHFPAKKADARDEAPGPGATAKAKDDVPSSLAEAPSEKKKAGAADSEDAAQKVLQQLIDQKKKEEGGKSTENEAGSAPAADGAEKDKVKIKTRMIQNLNSLLRTIQSLTKDKKDSEETAKKGMETAGEKAKAPETAPGTFYANPPAAAPGAAVVQAPGGNTPFLVTQPATGSTPASQ